MNKSMKNLKYLERKASYIRKKTLKLHLKIPETRIASSLSPIEIFVALFYGGILKLGKDRLVISKGHGSIAIYSILIDMGLLSQKELKNIGKENSKIGSIPDIGIPYVDIVNGSLGHGIGQACGIALGVKMKNLKSSVFVLLGDGELYEGSVWEGFMFASHHKLDNLNIIIDKNKICMLDYCKNIIDLEPLKEKLESFEFSVYEVDGHNLEVLYEVLSKIKKVKKPKVVIANTIKGKGIPILENDPLCHIRTLTKEEIADILNLL